MSKPIKWYIFLRKIFQCFPFLLYFHKVKSFKCQKMNSREGNFNLANVGVVSGWVRVSRGTTGLIRNLGWALQRNLYTEWGLNGFFRPASLCKRWICSILGRGSSPHWLILMGFFMSTDSWSCLTCINWEQRNVGPRSLEHFGAVLYRI